MKPMHNWQFIETKSHRYTQLRGIVGDSIVTTTPVVRLDGRTALTKSGSTYTLEGPHAYMANAAVELARAAVAVKARHP